MATFYDRELSWISFNGRVLQEAQDPRVPLLERLRFLAIFSSNLDEFFRVRVASLRALLRLEPAERKDLRFNPEQLLAEIHKRVHEQQEAFGYTFREELLPALAERGVVLRTDEDLGERERAFAKAFFERELSERLTVVDLSGTPFLNNRGLYLAVVLRDSGAGASASVALESNGSPAVRLGMVSIPSPPLPRFIELPEAKGEAPVMMLDDLVRANLSAVFPNAEIISAYSVKLTRDAELYLEDEFSGSLVKMIRESLSRRETGMPTRFLYDLSTPRHVLRALTQRLGLAAEDLVRGGRYHNFHDLFSFPTRRLEEEQFAPMPPISRSDLDEAQRLVDVIRERDVLLHFPYESYGYVTRYLDEAATDPAVTRIAITLYRVASDSEISRALIRAAQAGKQVTAFVEIKARFDEASNMDWAERMEEAGVKVIYSMPGIKVHCKVALVERTEEQGTRRYSYFGTGNFNEKTARIYADEGLLTADPRLTTEAALLFDYLSGENEAPAFEHLLVAPFGLRQGFERLIEEQIARAAAGKRSGMVLKMNSLEDRKMIKRLLKAAAARVPIMLIVRGICCMVTGRSKATPTVAARSLVGRFLEHARVYMFENGGQPRMYLASADWMKRNLSRRVEVAFPIYDPKLQEEIRYWMHLQMADSVKARVIDSKQSNIRAVGDLGEPVNAQKATYEWLRRKRTAAVKKRA